MSKLRFSVASLLWLVLLAAGGTAVLANPTEMWASALLTAAVTLMLVAVLGSIFGGGALRAFLLGFGLSGGAYLLMVFHPWFSGTLGPNLLTTKWLSYAERRLQSGGAPVVPPQGFQGQGGQGGFRTQGQRQRPLDGSTYTPSQLIGHSLWVLLIGFVGGLVARFFYVRRGQDDGQSSAVAAGSS